MNSIIRYQTASAWKNIRFIHTSSSLKIDHKWRAKNRLSVNPNAEGPLTNLPDYTYMDGRPTPLGKRQMQRVLLQRELAQKIVTGSWEIDYAIERHKKLKDEEANAKQKIIDSKLKPKGNLLLKKK